MVTYYFVPMLFCLRNISQQYNILVVFFKRLMEELDFSIIPFRKYSWRTHPPKQMYYIFGVTGGKVEFLFYVV